MRHSLFMLLVQPDDKSESYKLGTSWIIDSGLEGPAIAGENGVNFVSIRSLEYPDHYLRIMNGFTVVLQEFSSTDKNYTRDATFIVQKGLADPNLISFELLA